LDAVICREVTLEKELLFKIMKFTRDLSDAGSLVGGLWKRDLLRTAVMDQVNGRKVEL
jgi:hypothetical protein